MIGQRNQRGKQQYLCKWTKLNYSDCTWEPEEALKSKADKAELARFRRFNAAAAKRPATQPPKQQQPGHDKRATLPPPEFSNGMMLRDYQVESFQWMVCNFRTKRNVILGDEMGLGKTAQSVAVLEQIRSYESGSRARKPALVIVPLTTVGHWRREAERWTDMNVVVFTGTEEDRKASFSLFFSFSLLIPRPSPIVSPHIPR